MSSNAMVPSTEMSTRYDRERCRESESRLADCYPEKRARTVKATAMVVLMALSAAP